MINDGYCDCMGNGADEFNTDGCSLIHSYFICKNEGYKPLKIFNSRINDGVFY